MVFFIFIIIPLAIIICSIGARDSLGGLGVFGGIITGVSFSVGCFAIASTLFGTGKSSFLGLPALVLCVMGLYMMTQGYKKNKH